VIAIIGILVSLAISSYLSFIGRYRLTAEGRILNQYLQEARLRAISTGIPHGVAFKRNTAGQDYYFIFMDCAGASRPDFIYTDNDSNPDNNAPLESLSDCNTSSYDPRIRGESSVTLAAGNVLGDILGLSGTQTPLNAKLPFVVFNTVGQAVWGPDLAINPTGGPNEIVVRRKLDDGLFYRTGVTISPGTGLSYTFPLRRE
jgi:type II secretory pathway pseudopilin PulG